MIVYYAAKAQPIIEGEPVEDVVIKITSEIPNFRNLGEAAEAYGIGAKGLESILFQSLPGGTYDRLLIKMLERKASLFKVPFSEKE